MSRRRLPGRRSTWALAVFFLAILAVYLLVRPTAAEKAAVDSPAPPARTATHKAAPTRKASASPSPTRSSPRPTTRLAPVPSPTATPSPSTSGSASPSASPLPSG